MATINVLEAFTLNLGALLKRFEAGLHEVEDEIADHWYVKLHSERAQVASEPAPSTVAASSSPPSLPESVSIDDNGATHVDTPEEVSEKAALKAEAETLGVAVDGRWGVSRLQAEVDAAKAAKASA